MMRSTSAILASIGFLHHVSGASLTTFQGVKSKGAAIGKVISLLEDMQKQVETETKAGAEEAEKMENDCIAQITQLEGEVKFTTEKAGELQARFEEGSAKATKYASVASNLAPEIAALGDQKSKAEKEWKESDTVAKKEEGELVEAGTMLTKAHAVLKRSLGGEGGESLLQAA